MPLLQIRLLDAFQVALDDQPLTKLYSDRTRALLAYLVLERDRPHRRGELALLLWPDAETKKANQNLRQTLRQLRLALDNDSADPPFLLITNKTLQFNPNCDYWLDVEAVRDGEIALYRGGLLAQFYVPDSDLFNEWLLIRREGLHREVLGLLRQLARDSAESHNYPTAIRYAAQQATIDPWREEAYQDWIRYLIADGQTLEAQRIYEKCKQVLWDELGIEPAQETIDLLQQEGKRERERDRELEGARGASLVNVPPSKSPLIGRNDEIAEICDLITQPDCRWLTLVGLGGTGKTRLAIAVAHALAERKFADGIWYVSLVGAEDVLAMATHFDFSLLGTDPPRDQLVNFLRDKRLLLILDNCEHLLHEGAWLSTLLAEATHVKLLTTSRQSFDTGEEWVFDVLGLPTIAPDDGLSEAEQLFVQAAQRASARFRLQSAEKKHVTHLCQLVQGHPLSIELAATWVRLLSVGEISAEISRNLSLFETDLRHLPPRQRSLRVVFDHTWQTLTPTERAIMGRLAVFRGGFSRESAEAVADVTLLNLLQLINKSLVQRQGDRFGLHEAVRQYASEQSDDPFANMRHAEWFAGVAQTQFARLYNAHYADAERIFAADSDNFRFAWTTAVATDRADLIEQLLFGWSAFLQIRGFNAELAAHLGMAHEKLSGSEDGTLAIKLQAYHGYILFQLGEAKRPHALVEQVFDALVALTDENQRAVLLSLIARVYLRGEGRAGLTEALNSVLTETQHALGQTFLLLTLMQVARQDGAFELEQALGLRCLRLQRESGYKIGEALTLSEVGSSYLSQQKYDSAETYLREAITLAIETKNSHAELNTRNALGHVYLYSKQDFARAETEWLRALQIAQQLGIQRFIVRQSDNLATLYQQRSR